jgi:prepilin-type N-terminal cleavage/methylation domain-containing protein/prepilin-type processing-associated H-X9-DG protein
LSFINHFHQPGFNGNLLLIFGAIIQMQYSSIQKHHKNSGFTLIELLVVISIIALLIGILLPALAAARKSAQNVKDQTQLKQMGVAMEVYLNTYKGYFFPIHEPVASWMDMVQDTQFASAGGQQTIMAIIASLLATEEDEHGEWHEMMINEVPEMDSEILRSPLDPLATYKLVHDEDGGPELEPIISYAINGYFEVAGNNIRGMHKPSDVLIFAHRADKTHEGDEIVNGETDAHEVHFAFHGWEDEWWEDVSTNRVFGGSNYAFCDGHVKAMKEDLLTSEMAKPGDGFKQGEDGEEE